ncbi:SLAM family member 9-like isoform X1 [Coregonus clupeaformis]|uniref:SLAM family member 9-like isoform X1 n=1 Tax=Coregonus clupeaformis TaxID=59861 RepID=UPI001E1C4A8A|nr:SLAM family member 9-like isoform X1 [Coregonus clupeaformis]
MIKSIKVEWALLWCHVSVLCAAQHSAQPETRQVKGIVGKFLSFPERVLKSGNLLYGDLGNIAQVYPGKQSNTNLVKRFKYRLHWNNVTGFFTLSDLQIEDSGVYTVENADEVEEKTTHTFQLTVYYDLSKPQVTVHDNSSCSVVCSVENGREVTLSWYRGGEILNQSSSPDLNITLSLPLKVDEQNRDSYRCEAANPVSNETAVVPNSCIKSDPSKVTDGDERTQGCLIIAVICVLFASGLVGLAIYLKKGRNGHSQDSPERKQDDIQYTAITHINPADNQEERTGVLGDNPNLTSVYDQIQLYRMANSDDIDTA